MDLLQRTLPMHLREGGLRSKDSYALQMGCQRSNAMAPPQLPLKRDHGLWISHHCCSCWGREGWGGRVRGGYAHDAWRWTFVIWISFDCSVGTSEFQPFSSLWKYSDGVESFRGRTYKEVIKSLGHTLENAKVFFQGTPTRSYGNIIVKGATSVLCLLLKTWCFFLPCSVIYHLSFRPPKLEANSPFYTINFP